MTASELTQKITITTSLAGMDQINDLRGKIKGIGDETESTGAKSSGVFGRMKDGILSINPATLIAGAGLAAAAVGVAKLSGAVAGFVSGGIAANAQFETYNTQLGTLMGSTDAAKERMEELAAFGAATPFELPQLVEAEKVMIGFGLTTGKSMDLAKMSASDMRTVIGDVAAGTGKDFSEIALTFGKFSAGATGEAISRLQELGVVTREELAAQGVEFSKSGQLLSPLPLAFETATKIAQEKFGGGMAGLSNTFEGKMSTLSDTWGQIKRTMTAPIFDAAKAGLDAFLPVLGRFAEVVSVNLGDGTNVLTSAMRGLSSIFGELGLDAVAEKFWMIGNAVDGAFKAFQDAFQMGLDDGMDPLTAGIGALGDALAALGFAGIADKLQVFAAAASQALDVFTGKKDAIKSWNPEVQALGEKIVGFVEGVKSGAAQIMEAIANIDFASIASKIATVAGVIGKVFVFLATNPAIAGIVAAVAGIAAAFGVVMSVVGPFIPLVMSVIGVISGWVTAAGGLSAVLATVGAVLTGPVGLAIAGVIAAFVLWQAKGEEIKAALSAVATAIGEKFTQLKAELSQAWEDIKAAFNAAGQFIASQADLIKAVLLTIVTGGLILVYAGWVQYGDQIKAKAAEIVAWIKQKWEDLKAGTLAKWNEIKAAISAAIEAAKAKITEVLASIKAAWDAAWSGLGALAETAWNNVVATITTVFGIIRGLVETGIAFVRDTTMLGFNTILASSQAVWFAVAQVVEAGMIFIKGVVSAAMKLLQGDFSGAWAAIKQTVAIGIENVKIVMNNILNHITNLGRNTLAAAIGIGKSLGDGIRQGMEGAWDLVLGKLRALVDLLPQAVKDLLGIASPSRVFAELGEWITLGLASGIQKSDQKAVAALADVIGKMVSVANGLADFGKKIAEAIVPTDEQLATAKEKYLRMTLILTDFIKSISYLGSLLPVASVGQAGPGQIKAINAGLVQLSQGFPAIKELQGMVAEDLLTGGEADWASKLADMVGKIAGVWGGLADNMTKMATAVFPSNAQLDQLKESTLRIALWAADSLKNPTLPAVGAAEFAASMKSISDALSTVAGLNLAEITTITEGQLRIAGEKIVMAGGWAKAMVADWLATAGTAEERAAFLASLREFADTAGAAANVLKAGDIGDLSELAELLPDQLRMLGANIVSAGAWAKEMVIDWLKTAPSPEDRAKLVADMQDFAAMIGAAVGLAKAAAIGELKAEIEVDVIELRAVLNWVRNNLMPDMIAVADAWKETAEEAKRQTEHMQTFAGWLSAAIGLAKVADIGILRGDIEADVIELRAVLNWVKNNLAKEMQAVADAWEVAAKDAALMSERMQSFGGWISAAVGLAKVADIGTLKGDIEADVIELRAVLNWVKNNLAPEMVKVAEGWGETSEATKAMVEKMQSFASYITAAVNLAKAADIGTLATLTGTTDLGAKLEIVKANVLAVFGMVGQLAQGITTAEATARADLAEALGRGMKALGDFGGGITSLMDLAESKLFGSTAGTPGLGHTQRTRTRRADFYAQQLRDTVQRAVQAMQEALAGINIAPNDPKTEAIKQLGEAFGALANGLKAVAETKLPNAQQLAALVAALNGGGGSLGLAGAGAGAGGGAFSIANVRADTATIEGVSIGAVNLTAAVHIDGREIARAVASALITDVQILDDLGKALGERQARRP